MISPEEYRPGAADAEVRKDGEEWTLVLVRDLRHAPTVVWPALTDPAQLREWAPFDADRSLDAAGPVKLTTVGSPSPVETEAQITRAEAPRLLEYLWGGNEMRWELTPSERGTLLTLWAKIDRRFIAMGAAGWHLCLDVLARLLDARPIGRIVGADALRFEGWQRLHKEYAERFGVETPSW